jgi:hypothetical protein
MGRDVARDPSSQPHHPNDSSFRHVSLNLKQKFRLGRDDAGQGINYIEGA